MLRWRRLFAEDNSAHSSAHREVHGAYERVMALVDFIAGLTFVIGSVFFFFDALQFWGTWLFLIGSLCFCISPSLRVAKEFHLARLPKPLREAAAGETRE